jgi:hypothetical protein
VALATLRGPATLLVALLAVTLATAACEPTLRRETGLVVAIDSPVLGTVHGFDLRAEDGRMLVFDTRSLAFGEGFPAAHLSEHLALAEPILVTYRVEGGRNVVVRLDDAD